MIEFTGERVIPGQVESDLWSEHLARYAFARRFATGKNVLDAGCGTGYGSAELANDARSVTGIDLSFEAANYAAANYRLLPNLRFATASCEQLPFRSEAFDLVAGFEVIEHLSGYRAFVSEAARVLKPDGLFIVSTPNKHYYAETRAATGPNPYHQHEFEADEFECELKAAFGHVCMMVQNRVASFAFYRPNHFGRWTPAWMPAPARPATRTSSSRSVLNSLCRKCGLSPSCRKPLISCENGRNTSVCCSSRWRGRGRIGTLFWNCSVNRLRSCRPHGVDGLGRVQLGRGAQDHRVHVVAGQGIVQVGRRVDGAVLLRHLLGLLQPAADHRRHGDPVR